MFVVQIMSLFHGKYCLVEWPDESSSIIPVAWTASREGKTYALYPAGRGMSTAHLKKLARDCVSPGADKIEWEVEVLRQGGKSYFDYPFFFNII